MWHNTKIGGCQPSWALFERLDCKHILLDTTSYVFVDDFIRFGFRNEAMQIISDLQAFHRENETVVKNKKKIKKN